MQLQWAFEKQNNSGRAVSRSGDGDFVSTGIQDLDLLLAGGVPRGKLIEISGLASSGKTSLLFSILARASRREELVAYIDTFDSLDPAFAVKAGINLEKLLWIRSRSSIEKALKAADIVARSGGFGVLALNLEPVLAGSRGASTLKKIALSSWFRLQRAVEGTPTLILVLTREPLTGSAASLAFSLQSHEKEWRRRSADQAPFQGKQAYYLDGLKSEVRLLRGKSHGRITLHSHL
ncbi:MAG: ATPase domain-containing protein [Acidobacteriota bacterium]